MREIADFNSDINAVISANPVNTDPKTGGFASPGDLISQSLEIAFAIAAMTAFFYALWGVYQYIFAGGNKEGLGKARARITWAIVGLVILGMAFAISQFVESFLVTQPLPKPITEVKGP